MKIGIVDNKSFNSLPDDIDFVISKFWYNENISEDIISFIIKTNKLIIGLNEYKFINDNIYNIQYVNVIRHLRTKSCYCEFELDNLKYIILNGSISQSTAKINNIIPGSIVNWIDNYDGKLGYFLSTHDRLVRPYINYYDYGSSLPYVRGQLTIVNVEKNSITLNN